MRDLLKNPSMEFSITPQGPFDLLVQNQFFGGWPTLEDQNTIVLTFPVEGWKTSASVTLMQKENGEITGTVYGAKGKEENAWNQALAILSLDVDGSSWPDVGKKDPIIGKLQKKYGFIRPNLFQSPYEAAASFIIGHRISIKQRNAIAKSLAENFGDKIQVNETTFYGFPQPQVLKTISSFKAISGEKIERLQGVAEAAIDGLLTRKYLRSISVQIALDELKKLRGVGDFFAQGILMRGAGLADSLTEDEMSKKTIQVAYDLPDIPNTKELAEISENWKPYRMWALVLLHIWERRELGASYWSPPKKK